MQPDDTIRQIVPDSDEASLLERLRSGDPAAAETLVRDNLPRMLAVARRVLGNEQDAQDAVQDAFQSAFRALPGFHGESRLSTWLHRIAVNAALMKRRSLRRRRLERPLDALVPAFREDGRADGEVPSYTPTPRELLEREEFRARIRDLIEELPEDYRNIILLRDIEELDGSETARVLGITPNAVKTRLHRARQALRTLIEQDRAR